MYLYHSCLRKAGCFFFCWALNASALAVSSSRTGFWRAVWILSQSSSSKKSSSSSNSSSKSSSNSSTSASLTTGVDSVSSESSLSRSLAISSDLFQPTFNPLSLSRSFSSGTVIVSYSSVNSMPPWKLCICHLGRPFCLSF